MKKWVGSVPRRCFSAQFNSVKKRSLWKTTVISMSKKLQQEDHDITWFWNATEMRDARQSPPRLFKDWEIKKSTTKHFQLLFASVLNWPSFNDWPFFFNFVTFVICECNTMIFYKTLKFVYYFLYLTYRKDTG